jgi:hypothetical protein
LTLKLFSHLSGIGPKKPIQIAASGASATGHTCPICGIQLSLEELESHFSTELGRLAKPNMYNERQELRRTLSMELHAVQSSLQSRTSRWEVRVCAFDCVWLKFSNFVCNLDFPTHPSQSARTSEGKIAQEKIRRGCIC